MSAIVGEGYLIKYLLLLIDGLDIQKKCLVVSDLPQEHTGESKGFCHTVDPLKDCILVTSQKGFAIQVIP